MSIRMVYSREKSFACSCRRITRTERRDLENQSREMPMKMVNGMTLTTSYLSLLKVFH